jgi:hypothetical protein
MCPSCGRSAWCEGDRILVIPCEHHGYCGDCNLENCQDCRLAAEREMYHSGEYDPRADPLFVVNDNAAEYAAELAEWARESGYDARTNSYQRKRP